MFPVRVAPPRIVAHAGNGHRVAADRRVLVLGEAGIIRQSVQQLGRPVRTDLVAEAD